MRRILLGVAGAAILVVVFFVLRPDDDGDEASPPTTTTTPTTTTGTRTTTTTKPAPPPVRTIRLTVRSGRPLGGIKRPVVDKGLRVVIVVRSDIADHVHLHGYDIMRDVAPGRPARIRFRARIPGRFEIELEDSRLLLAQLEVRP